VAGKLANAHRGGVSVQTTGANALAALRVRKQLGLLSPAEAFAPSQARGERAALGVDMLGVLGWDGPAAAVAAAAVPNRTTETAGLILPMALPCELGGTFVQAGTRAVKTSALLPPPAGVPTPAGLLRQMAAAAGVAVKPWSGQLPALDRLAVGAPPESPGDGVAGRVLVGARDPIHHSAGELTSQASWQRQLRELPELRLAPADAGDLGVTDMDEVEVQTDSCRTRMRVRVVRHLTAGTLVASQGCGQARRATPCQIDADRDALVSPPAGVLEVKKVPARGGKQELELRFV
jgi:anaerobic selenocysteine-containing dehydrogenase